ncbi:MAG TPA: GNAT family N-acetyltransferase [Nocardioidaceae bacterium]|jgi:RimJ/RimL family protein N-acetyltransferase
MEFPDDVPVLTNGDVTLRAHRTEDVEGVFEQCTDPVSVRWTTVPLDYTAEMAREFVTARIPAMWADDTEWLFAIEATHHDGHRRFGGTLSLRAEGHRRAEIAFGAHPGVRGHGVMTTAVNLLLDWGFHERDLETIIWLAERGNFASRRVAWKSGFTFGGVLPKWLDHRGTLVDAWTGTLHRTDAREPTHTWYDVPVLTGESVVVRPQRLDDADRIVEACSDEITQYWVPSLPSPFTRDDAVDSITSGAEAAAQGNHLQWAVADRHTDQLVAVVGLPRIKRGNAEVGYWTHPAARGRGVMKDALGQLIRHAFTAVERGGLGLHRLYVRTGVANVASQRVATANGFVPRGTERQVEQLRDGTYTDFAFLDLLRDEWEG